MNIRIKPKSLMIATGVAFGLMVLKEMMLGWSQRIIAYQLFGEVGAYSSEDHDLVRSQISYLIFDLVLVIAQIAIPCYIAAKLAIKDEVVNAIAMLLLLVFLAILLVPIQAVVMYFLIGLVPAMSSGVIARKRNKNKV
jgi:hypothetical protein